MATPTQSLIARVLSNLQAVLPGLITAQAGLPSIVEYLSYAPKVPVPAKAPQIFVVELGSRRDNSGAHGATIQKYAENRRFAVGCTIAANDEATATTQRDAYADLIRQAVEQDLNAGGNALWVAWQSTDHSPGFPMGTALYLETYLEFEAPRRVLYGKA